MLAHYSISVTELRTLPREVSRWVVSSALTWSAVLWPVRWEASANRAESSHRSQFRAALAMVGESLWSV